MWPPGVRHRPKAVRAGAPWARHSITPSVLVSQMSSSAGGTCDVGVPLGRGACLCVARASVGLASARPGVTLRMSSSPGSGTFLRGRFDGIAVPRGSVQVVSRFFRTFVRELAARARGGPDLGRALFRRPGNWARIPARNRCAVVPAPGRARGPRGLSKSSCPRTCCPICEDLTLRLRRRQA